MRTNRNGPEFDMAFLRANPRKGPVRIDRAKKINITIPRTILAKIDREAYALRMSRSEFLRFAAIAAMKDATK